MEMTQMTMANSHSQTKGQFTDCCNVGWERTRQNLKWRVCKGNIYWKSTGFIDTHVSHVVFYLRE